jgi:hypothetical protein
MMIKHFLFGQRRGLKLLILSLFILHSVLLSQEKDEGLELPQVYIYGSYLQKITFSPKKDFFPYIGEGNLFPLSRETTPGLHFPGHEREMGRFKRIDNYWMLVDAAIGNWWSDKVFLDCGLKNDIGLLSLRFTDFRRKGWEEDHSKANDYLMLKGVMGDENYYLSGNVFYDYDRIVADSASLVDTATTHIVGLGLFSRFEFNKVFFSLFSELSRNHFKKHCEVWWAEDAEYETIQENLYRNFLTFNIPFDFIEFHGNVFVDGAEITGPFSGGGEKTITSLDFFLKKTFNNIVTISPGLRTFIGWKEFNLAPLISLRTVISNLELYPFISYMENRRINTLKNVYGMCPFVLNIEYSNYSVQKEKNISTGLEGKWQKLSYLGSYSHIEYENYPVIRDSFQIDTIRTVKDIVKANIILSKNYFNFNFTGIYTSRERILYEPVSEFELTVKYEEFPKITPFASLNSKFAIETETDTVDIFSVNGGVESQLLENLVLRFDVENIFDQRYEIWEGYTQGGIQFYLSAKYKIAN